MAKQTIIVDGGYQPNQVTFKQGEPAELVFKRVTTAGVCKSFSPRRWALSKIAIE